MTTPFKAALLGGLIAALLQGQAIRTPRPAAPPTQTPRPAPNTAAPGRVQPARPAAEASKPAAAPSVKDLKFPPLRTVTIPNVDTFSLPNGMKLFLLEDHELPVINGIALVRTGSVFDPADKIGLADITGDVMRTGGTAKKTGEQLDVELENLAATVETDIGQNNGSVTFSCLKENAGVVLAAFHDVMTAPEFRQDKIDLAKSQAASAIARRNDDAARIAAREFRALVYGKDSPYGRRPEYSTIGRITRADLQEFYHRYFFPANVMVGIWGDFDSAAMKESLGKLFADWTAQQPPAPEFPAAASKPEPGTFVAAKKDVTQTFFAAGQLGGELRDPDYPALEIMATILGGGFQSRLMERIRSTMGDAYQISATWAAGYDHPGAFEISGSTKSLSTLDTLKAVREEAERLRSAEVTEQELLTAKDTALRSLVFASDSRSKTLRRLLTYEYFHYPKDFLERYQKGIEAVTRADVLRVAKQRLDPANFTFVAVGNPQDFGPRGLEGLGNAVVPIDLTIPQPTLEAAKSDAAGRERGKQILARAQQAAGGADRLAAVRDYTQSADFHLANGLLVKEVDQWLAPTYFRQETDVPAGKIRVFYNGKTGWIAAVQGSGPLGGAQLKQVEGDLFRVIYRLLLSDRIPERTVNAIDDHTVEIGGQAGQIAQVSLDPATGLIASVRYQTITVTGPPSLVEETWSDFRDAEGIKIPHKITITQNGSKFADVSVTEYHVNSGLKLQDLEKRP